jgi:hypothetical protein
VIAVYAPVEGTGNDIEEFYNLLQKIPETTSTSDLTLVMGFECQSGQQQNY